MPYLYRISVILLLAALAGCSSSPAPVARPVTLERPIQVPLNSAADDVLFRALGLVGTPYRYGGNTPDSGFDCSGLIGYVYRDTLGIVLPRSTSEMVALKAPSIPEQGLHSGDLVFFATAGGGRVSHAGIYVGEGRFVHAPSTGGTVRLDSLSNSYWKRHYLTAKRVLDSSVIARNP